MSDRPSPSPSPSKRKQKNAFETLLTAGVRNKRKRPLLSSGHLPCPVCNRHVIAEDIHRHLDQCLQRQQQKKQPSQSEACIVSQSPSVSKTQSGDDCHEDDNEKLLLQAQEEQSVACQQPNCRTSTTTNTSTHSPVTKDSVTLTRDEKGATTPATLDNTFRLLMENARKQQSQQQHSVHHHHRFHLDRNGNVQLFFEQATSTTVVWSATVKLRANHNDDTSHVVTLTSDDRPRQQRSRFVQHHSRLSPAVLKSILQKSIRRRRPGPSIRIAMEWMDKNHADVWRRLPIIIMEDSVWHPHFPWLLWHSMASSKGYHDLCKNDDSSSRQNEPRSNHNTWDRLWEIIHQVASCRYRDVMNSSPTKEKEEGGEITLTQLVQRHDEKQQQRRMFTSNSPAASKQRQPATPVDRNVLRVWSLLVRARYGGMSCDVRMLEAYAQTWCDRTCNSSSQQYHPQWAVWTDQQLPKQTQSLLQKVPLEALRLSDVCLEGVDFHCSNLLDDLEKDVTVRKICSDLVALDHHGQQQQQRASLSIRDVLQQCIWNFSAGVNFRRLLPHPDGDDTCHHATRTPEPKEYSELWYKILKPKVTFFQEEYVKRRLWSLN